MQLKKLLEVSPCDAEHLKQCAVTYESHKHTAGDIKGNTQRVSKVDSTNKKKQYADITCFKCYKQGHMSF